MRIFKRLVSALLAFVMLAGMVPPITVHAEENESVLLDVTAETAASTEGTTAPAAETTVSTEETTIPTEESSMPTVHTTVAPEETEATEETENVEETESVEETETSAATEETQPETAPLDESAVAGGTCGETVTWTLDAEGTLTISGTGAMENYQYTYSAPWYSYFELVNTIVIEEGITRIGDYAFSSCRNLVSVTLPESATSIGSNAFSSCGALTTITLGEGIQEIAYRAFANTNLSTVIIPASVISIGNSAFGGCTNLKEIHFKGDAPTIHSYTFCDNLDPNSQKVTAVAYYPPDNSTWTNEVRQNYGGNLTWVAEGDIAPVAAGQCGRDLYWTLDENGVLTITGTGTMKTYNVNEDIPWYAYRSDVRQIVVNEGATNISRAAFSSMKNLTKVTLPESLTKLGPYAFDSCVHLEEIVLPDAVQTIEQSAFYRCQNLQTITLAQNIAYIGRNAFEGTPWYHAQLAEAGCVVIAGVLMEYWGGDSVVEIPASVKVIGEYVFYNCSQLESVTIPEGVVSIGKNAFDQCAALKTVNLPSALDSIGSYAFRDCAALDSISLPEGLRTIGEYAFSDCASLTSVVLPDSLTKLGYAAFLRCTGLTEVHIGSGLRALERNLFEGCTSLTKIEIPVTITLIESYAFNGCTKLADVIFREGTALLGGYEDPWEDPWYEGDSDTEVIYPDPGTALEIQWQAFGNCSALTEVYLPSHLSNLASTAFQGSMNTTHFYVSSAKYISDASGAIYGHSGGVMTTLVCVPAKLSGKFVIPSTVTRIYADFYGCSQLTSLTFSAGAGGVGGSDAFYGCTSLTEIIAGAGNDDGYYNDAAGALICENYGYAELCVIPADLTEYTVPANVNYIYTAGFSNAPLTAVYVEQGSESFFSEDGVLFSIDGTELIKYPGSKTGSSYVIPASVDSLSEYAFSHLKNLKEIWFSGEPFYVNSYAFYEAMPDGGTPITGYYPKNIWGPDYASEMGYITDDYVNWKPYTLLITESGSTGTIERDVPLAIRTSRNLSGLKSVQLDGTSVAASNYVITESSNLVRFKTSWLNPLADGEHTIRLQFTDGYEEVSTHSEASADTAELEALLAEASLTNGWVNLTKPVVLTKSLTIDNCTLSIYGSGHLTVPQGVTLTVNGQLYVDDGGKLDVQTGGYLVNNDYIRISARESGSYIHVDGSCQIARDARVYLEISGQNIPDVTGIDKQYLSLNAYDIDAETLLPILELQDQGYGNITISISSDITLNEDVTIGKNTRLNISPNYDTYKDATLTINGSVLLEGELYIGEYSEYGIYGIVQNNGTLTIAPSGELDVYGKFLGNEPVLKALTQDELEAQLAEAAQTGDTVDLRVPLVLERDLTLQDCGLYIQGSGHLTVPSGITLTLESYVSISNGGRLDVKAGGSLVNNGSLSIYDSTGSSYIHVDGSYVHGAYGYVSLEYANGILPEIAGIAKAYQNLNFYDADEAMLLQAIAMQDQGYQSIWVSTSNLELNTDVTIGQNMTLRVNPSYSDDQKGLIINSNVILDGQLYVSAYQGDNAYGRVQNNGTLTVSQTGELQINGIFQGNDPVFKGISQDELEQQLAQAALTGDTVFLKTPLVLERDLTVNDCDLLITGSGHLTVPNNITLTNNGYISVRQGGKLDVDASGKLINNGNLNNWDISSTSYIHVNGTYINGEYGYVNMDGSIHGIADVTGIESKYLHLSFYDADEATLLYALTLEAQGYQSIMVTTSDMVLNTDVTIGENTELYVEPSYDAYNHGLIINSNVKLNGYLYVAAYDDEVGIVQNNGSLTVNETGVLQIHGSFLGNAPINNGGYIQDNNGAIKPEDPEEPTGITQKELEKQLARAKLTGDTAELTETLVLERDLTINGASLDIWNGGHLIVPTGVTLTIDDYSISIYQDGKLDIEAGGKLVNGGWLFHYDDKGSGYIHVNGTYEPMDQSFVILDYSSEGLAEVTGIDKSYQSIQVRDADEELFFSALVLQDQGYGCIDIDIKDVTLDTDVTIGENVALYLTPDYETGENTFTINSNMVLNGSLWIGTYNDYNAVVQNNGTLIINDTGYLMVRGSFLGNAPVVNGGEIDADIKSIDITQQDMTVDASQVKELVLTIAMTPLDQKLLPTRVPALEWTSSNKKIIDPDAITNNGDGTYTVPFTGKTLGTVKLTAKNDIDRSLTDSITLTVCYLDAAKKLTATADIPAIGLQGGETAQMLVFGSDAETALNSEYLSFTSSNEDIAAVDASGVITAGSKTGTAKITASIKDDPLKRKVTLNVKVIAAQTKTLSLLDEAGTELTAMSLDLADLNQKAYTFRVSPNPGYAEGISAPALSKKSFKWTSSNTKLATIKANDDGSADVTIKAGVHGACTITAQTTDLAKITASFELTVIDRSPRLGSGSITLNPMMATGAEITLVSSYGNNILAEEISFTDARLTARYESESGTLTILAEDTLSNGTISTKLNVPCMDGNVYTYDLKVTVKNQAPSITVKQTSKLDLFYADSEAVFTVTAKNAVVEHITLAETEDFEIVFNGESGILTFSESYLADHSAKPDTKASLEVWLEGYSQPVTKSITIATTTSKLSLSTDPTSSIINTALSDDYRAFFRVYNKKTGEALRLTYQDIEAVEAAFVENCNVTDDGQVSLTLTGTSGGTASIYIKLDNWMQSVKLTHKVTTNTSLPTVRLGATTLKLNSLFPSQAAVSSVSLSQGNLSISGFGDFSTTAKAGSPTYTEAAKIYVYYDGSNIAAVIRDPLSVPKNGTYSYTAVPIVEGRELAPVTVKVNVSTQEPKVKLSSSTMKLNTLLAGSETAADVVSLNNSTGYDLAITDFLGMDAHSEYVDLSFDEAAGEFQATLKSDAAAKYTYTLTPVVRDETGAAVELSSTVKLTVQAKKATISVSQSVSGKLDVVNLESAVVCTVNRINNAIGEITDVALLNADGTECQLFLAEFGISDAGKQTVTLKLDPAQTYSLKETYKVKLRYTICGMTVDSSVISVKLTQSKLMLTAGNCQYFQSQTIPMIVRVALESPAGARIKTVAVNTQETSKELLTALGITDTLAFVFPEGTAEAALRLDVKVPGALTAGKNYTLYLDLTPAACGSDTAPTAVKVTVIVKN